MRRTWRHQGHRASSLDRSRLSADRQHAYAPLRQWIARAHVAWEVNTLEDRLLYRVTEVAVFLNVSRSKIYELLASGDLPSVKIDRTRLIRGSDLRD